MTQFIDLGTQILESKRHFAFFRPVSGHFLFINDCQVWSNWDELAKSFIADRKVLSDKVLELVGELRRLCPEWVTNTETSAPAKASSK